MSSQVIDEKVVEMKFDNKDFESNVQTSLSTLKKLKEGLDLKESAESLKAVDKNVRKIDLSSLSDGVESVRMKFNALDVAAATVVSNITSSLLHMGTKVVKEFTLDPIISGFQEYETQINAIQTILANTKNKGTTLDDVNSALDELNHYADMTIYNFTQMTKNIGTFTAAGVDLDTSVSAIKGIANLAAVSGSNAQQASTAMYQLSQALASGTVKLQDWNSVVNAGMGGEVFQEALKRTARVMGEDVDGMIEKAGSFRESLKSGWLTTQVLTETLKQFTGDMSKEQLQSMGYTEQQIDDIIEMGKTANEAATKVKTFTQLIDTLKEAAQSGWTQTWELIVGDFDQAKELWTSISDNVGAAIQKSADRRNKIIKKAFGSQTEFIKDKTDLDKVLINKKDYDAYVTLLEHTAKASGVPIDDMIKKYGSFEETLKTGWLDKDLMKQVSNSLTQLRGGMTEKDLSDLHSQVEAIVKGQKTLEAAGEEGYDTDKLSEYINKIGELTDWSGKCNDALLAQADSALLLSDDQRKTIKTQLMQEGITEEAADALIDYALATNHASQQTKLFSDLVDQNGKSTKSGRELLIGAAKNIASTFGSLFSSIGKGFSSIFKADWGQILYNTFKKIYDFTSKIKFSPQTLAKIQNVGSGIATVLQMIWKAITHIASAIGKLVGPILESVGSFALSLFSDLASGLKWIADWFAKNEKIQGFLKGVNGVLSAIGSSVKTVFNKIKAPIDYFKKVYALSGKSLKTAFTATFKKYTKAIGDFFKNGDGSLKSISQIFSTIGTSIKSGLDKFFPGVVDAVTSRLKKLFQTVHDAFSLLISNPKEAFSKIGSWLSGIVKSIKEHVDELFPGMISGIKDAFVSGWTKFKDWIIKLFTNPKQWWEDTKGAFEHFFSGLGDNINGAAEGSFGGIIKKVKDVFAKLVKKIADNVALLFTDPKAFFEKVKKKLSGVKDRIAEWIQKAFPNLLPSISKTFSKIFGKFKDSKFGKIVSDLWEGLKGIFSSIGEAFKNTKDQIKPYQNGFSIFFTFIKNLFLGLKKVSNNDTLRAIKNAALFIVLFKVMHDVIHLLGNLLGSILHLINAKAEAIQKHAEAEKIDAIGHVILSIAALAVVACVLGTMPADRMWRGVAALGVITGLIIALAVVCYLIDKKSSKITAGSQHFGQIEGVGKSLLALAGSVMILVIAFRTLAKGLRGMSPTQIISTIGVLAILCGMMVGVAFLMSRFAKVSNSENIGGGVGKNVLLISAAIIIMVRAYNSIARIVKGQSAGQIFGTLGVLTAIAALLVGVQLASSEISKHAGVSNLFGLIAVAVAIRLMIDAFLKVSQMPISTVWKGLLNLIPIFIALGTIMFMMKRFGTDKGSISNYLGIIAIAFSLKIIVSAVLDLASTKQSKLAGATLAMMGLMGMMSVMLLCVSFMNKQSGSIGKGIGNAITIIAIAASLSLIASAVCKLSEIKPNKLALATTAMILLGTCVGLLYIVMNVMQSSSISGGVLSIIQIAAIAGALYIVAMAMVQLGELSSNKIGQAVLAIAAITACIGALTIVGAICKTALPALVGMSLLAISLAFAVKLIAEIPFDQGIAAAIGLGLLANMLVVAVLGISVIGTFPFPVIANGLLGFLLVIGVLSAVLIAIKALGDATGFDILYEVGEAIGHFVAGIIDGCLEKSKQLPKFAVLLSSFAASLSMALTTIKSMGDSGGLDSLGSLATSILKFTGAELLDGITQWITGGSGLEKFGSSLTDLATGLAGYITTISGLTIDNDKLTKSTDLLQMVTDICDNIPKDGGVVQAFMGTIDIDEFSTDMPKLATAVAGYCNALTGVTIDDGVTEASGKLLTMITDICDGLPTSGGIVKAFLGSIDIDGFSTDMPKLANGVKGYCDALANVTIDSDMVDRSGKLISMLADIASEEMPKKGGFLSWVTGSKLSLGDFGSNMKGLATGLKEYLTVLNGNDIDLDQSDKSGKLLTMLATIASNDMPTTGGFFSWVTGKKQDLGSFGDNLSDLAKGLGEYVDEISKHSFTDEKVTAASTAIQTLSNISAALKYQNLGNSNKDGDLKNFADELVPLAQSISEYYTTMADVNMAKLADDAVKISNMASSLSGISDIDSTKLSKLQTAMDGLGNLDYGGLEKAASSVSKNISGGFANSGTEISDSATKMMKSARSAVEGTAKDFRSTGTMIAEKLLHGLESRHGAIQTALSKSLLTATSKIRGLYSSFKDSGEYIAYGLINGINAKQGEAYRAGYELGKAAHRGEKDAVKEGSPAKELIKSGQFIAMGLVIGIKNYEDRAYKAGYGLGSASSDGTQRALDEASRRLQNGIDDTMPTIRPVIDLSNMQSDLATMNDLLNANNMFTLNPNMSAVRSNFNSAQRDASNQDVVDAVTSLNKTLGGISANNYTINGITYDDGSNVSSAIQQLVSAARLERRV